MDQHKKRIARLIKKMLDSLSSVGKSDPQARFNAKINNKVYNNLDIAKVIRTFSDTLSEKEPELEIIDVSNRPAEELPPKPLNSPSETQLKWVKQAGQSSADKTTAQKSANREQKASVPFHFSEQIEKYRKKTKYGTPVLWWDTEGELRASGQYTVYQQTIMHLTDSPKSKFWQNPRQRALLVGIYLEFYQVMDQLFIENKELRRDRQGLYPYNVEFFLKAKYKYYYRYTLACSKYIARLAEDVFRRSLPKIRSLNCEAAYQNLAELYPEAVVSALRNFADHYPLDVSSEAYHLACEELLSGSVNDWRFAAEYLNSLELKRTFALLIDHQEQLYLEKIAGLLIKNAKQPELLLVALLIKAKFGLKKAEAAKLDNLIPARNIETFYTMANSYSTLSLSLIEEVLDLRWEKRKEVQLQRDQIKKAEAALVETVQLVDDFIGELTEGTVESFAEQAELESTEKEDKAQQESLFLEQLLEQGKIGLRDVEKFSEASGKTVAVFISEINRSFYPLLEDQLLTLDEEYCRIDEFYIEDLARYLAGNKKN